MSCASILITFNEVRSGVQRSVRHPGLKTHATLLYPIPRHCRPFGPVYLRSQATVTLVWPPHCTPVGMDKRTASTRPSWSWGWTVFQQRTSDAVSHHFFRIWIINWALATWRVNSGLGLDLPHQLTSTTLQQLRIDLDDYEGEHRYSGHAGNSLLEHNGVPFSTHDADNDKAKQNCA
ncbi:ficolin-3-like [Scylla paramamosain]|uniref:ficolin-3-like n=1 Tax=Scylla paramamosain TaxID=85552 RepID=UPI003082CB76